jgi:hypothetical protein
MSEFSFHLFAKRSTNLDHSTSYIEISFYSLQGSEVLGNYLSIWYLAYWSIWFRAILEAEIGLKMKAKGSVDVWHSVRVESKYSWKCLLDAVWK